MTERSVQVHYFNEDGYVDWREPEATAICVYLRTETPDDPQQPFDLSHETDFHLDTRNLVERETEALAYAEGLARHFECPVETY